MSSGRRVENALARAQELLAIDNKNAALDLLHEAVMARWFQHNLHELDAIMKKFVELCVDMRKGKLLKDGLYQYRSASHNASVQGLEDVMGHYLRLSQDRLAAAVAQYDPALAFAADAGALAAAALEEDGPARAPLGRAGTMTAREEKERSDRENITPWLRFVWEAYRTVLDICRNNAKMQDLYRTVIQGAFAFCLAYNRKMEFKRICEILRHHLGIIVKYSSSSQANGILLADPASHQLQLELRFAQLDAAVRMELWHEAFKSIEDIHGLFVLARKSAKPALVITYYERLCRVFQMSSDFLFYAATMCKLFVIQERTAGAPDADRQASLTVLALLAAPLFTARDGTNTMSPEEVAAKHMRLAYFIGMKEAPTRKTIARELFDRGIFERASPIVRELFQLVEEPNGQTFSKARITEILTALQEDADFAPFVPVLHRNIIANILQGVSQIDKPLAFSSLVTVLSFPGLACAADFSVDAFILDGCRVGDFYAKIDHIRGTITFERPCFACPPLVEAFDDASTSSALSTLASIEAVVAGLQGRPPAAGRRPISLCKGARQDLVQERKANLVRKGAIERLKEITEEVQLRREREELREKTARQQAERELERKRHVEESARREAARIEEEREAIRREQIMTREGEEARRREAIALRDNLEKLIAVVRRVDHLERALRQEEAPLLATGYAAQKEADLLAHQSKAAVVREAALARHTADAATKERLVAIRPEMDRYRAALADRREAAFCSAQAEAQDLLAKAKERRVAALLEKKLLRPVEKERAAVPPPKTAYVPPSQRATEGEARPAVAPPVAAVQESAAPATKAPYVPPSRRAKEPLAAPEAASGPFQSRATTKASVFGSRAPAAPLSPRSADGDAVQSGDSWRK